MMTVRSMLLPALAMVAAAPSSAAAQDGGPAITRIAFGSCAHQSREQPIWDAVLASEPDLFVFLGDNVYGDTRDMDELRAAYGLLAAQPGFRALNQATQVIATWDDHDYGENDAGADYPMREESRQVFLEFWGEPEGSPRWNRDGVYAADTYGPAGRRVQVILLDLRYNRSEQVRVSDADYAERDIVDMGPYAPTDDLDQNMLGDAQWVWLEQQLRQPADLRIIGTSLPFAMAFTGWETWANYPLEQQYMIDLIDDTGAEGVLFISGDTHWAEFSRLDEGVPYPLWDVTSSGLTEEWYQVSPNANRVGDGFTYRANYGLIAINWDLPDPQIVMDIRNVADETVLRQVINLSDLRR